jgi:hypothetical protein
MKIRHYVLLARNYLLTTVYLFVVFGAIYGLVVDELNFDLFLREDLIYTLTGWRKNTLCLLGLILAALVPAYPVLIAVYRALRNAEK